MFSPRPHVKTCKSDIREFPILDWALEGAQSASRVGLECSSRRDETMGGGIFGSTTQPSWKGRAPQRCPTHVEEPYREYIVKESRWLDSFMERELNPPPAPPSYDITPPNSRPGTATPHFSSTSLRPKPGEGAVVAVGCVPEGPVDPMPEPPMTKIERRARATALVAAAHRERLRAAGVNKRGVADRGAGTDADPVHATRAWQANKTLRHEDAFVTIREKQRVVDAARREATRRAAGNKQTITRRVSVASAANAGTTWKDDAVRETTLRRAPKFSARTSTATSSKPRTAAASEVIIATRATGAPGEQSSPLVLNLDHLEDSSIEVLLHELRKAEKAVAAGEEPPETYAAAAAALAARGTNETN